MRSIAVKLTLAFLLVGLIGATLVAAILHQRTRRAFDEFIANREQSTLIDNLVAYYQANRGWDGVGDTLPALLIQPPRPYPQDGASTRQTFPFTLVGADRKIVYNARPEMIGETASSLDLERAIPLQSGEQTIGWLALAPLGRELAPNSPEGLFLQNINRAALASALVAAALALTLGGLLAFTLTRTLRDLTEATNEIAGGRPGRQVKVRSQDELGDLAASFNRMSLDLERATQARRQMTADIAHELRSPLSVISGYSEALSDGKLPGSPEVYTILYNQSQHLSRLVDDLRTLSLVDAGELSLNLQTTDPRTILHSAAARHTFSAGQREIALQVEAAPDLPSVMVDPERIAQVVDNLVGNALRHSPPGEKIILAAQACPGGVQLRVSDFGSGIAAEDLPHIFNRFYRGDKARHEHGESGLGLAIAKSIIELHKGAIAAESDPDQGTVFTISLPGA